MKKKRNEKLTRLEN